MSQLVRIRAVAGSMLLCVALAVSACSSSGGGAKASGGSDSGVTVQQIADKLKSESQLTAVKAQIGNNAAKFNKVVDCIANTMKKDIDGKDLKAYVHGDKKITDLKKFASQVQADATSCIKSALGSG